MGKTKIIYKLKKAFRQLGITLMKNQIYYTIS